MTTAPKSTADTSRGAQSDAPASWLPVQSFFDYATDFWQRNALFWDVMRQRGNQYLEHAAEPVQHVLSYDFETVMSGADLERPVNYGLVRIKPPAGVKLDDGKRPFVIVDPRAGHGPGIGGFKPDSQVGAILKAGHPCYFIGFLAEPEPGQTIEDVGRAELVFLEHVASLHPATEGKPCVIANCQAGWAMMMLAAVAPDAVGPLLIAGSPLSYWAGVRGKNPMRYLGGLLGGSWMTALAGDMGHGIFDGAYLVNNFESLNPANTLVDKPYNLWSKVDTEADRYLDFERWWGGHVLLGDEEMQSIADELFVGNHLVQGKLQTSDGVAIDLRNIRSPIVVFCSHGDNITPPQQALHWILDLYDDVDEIRAYGQTIIYTLHHDIGHLGIFVSGKVGRKEYDQFTQNMDLIDIMPPGLYEAVIRDKSGDETGAELAYGDYIVSFERRTLDDIRALGDQDDDDERAFETVARVSEINLGLYRTFLSPFVRAASTEQSARWLRDMHPARLQYSLLSDRNPWLAWAAPLAANAAVDRDEVAEDNPFLAAERQLVHSLSGWVDAWRAQRDDAVEKLFFATYGSELLQALVGLRSNSGMRQQRPAPHHPAIEALIREKVAKLKAGIASGGQQEAAVRALIYVGLPKGQVDERSFGALKRMHEQAPGDKRMSLAAFKQLVREQYFMLLLDEPAALAALPDLLPTAPAVRRDLLERVRTVVTASGTPVAEVQERLQELARLLGVDQAAEAKNAGKAAAQVAGETAAERADEPEAEPILAAKGAAAPAKRTRRAATEPPAPPRPPRRRRRASPAAKEA